LQAFEENVNSKARLLCKISKEKINESFYILVITVFVVKGDSIYYGYTSDI
jgi:hypothetical protein